MENLDKETVSLPKKRGRKPGSKNKVKASRTPKKFSYLGVFSALEQEIQSLGEALKNAKAEAQKEMEKLEKASERAIEKIKAKAVKSISLWKSRAKTNLSKAKPKTGTGRRGRPAKAKVEKELGRRGRPPKGGYRKGGGRRKVGELTKRDVILNYVKEVGHPIATGDLIQALFERSGEREKKRFSQGMYTTLTQMYKSGSLIKSEGIVTLP